MPNAMEIIVFLRVIGYFISFPALILVLLMRVDCSRWIRCF